MVGASGPGSALVRHHAVTEVNEELAPAPTLPLPTVELHVLDPVLKTNGVIRALVMVRGRLFLQAR